jgi:pyruvate/oxaloacetate carboxyltransferase
MIIDIFRLFDQIKDERNSKVTFSNYLKKTH